MTKRSPDVRVRIAPSPTGPLHIGTARTALFNYLFARRHGGTFILRLEDTDVVRSSPEYEQDILEHLHWLGLDWDEGPDLVGGPDRGPYGPYRQMLRLSLYRAAAERLLAEDKAYFCYCTPDELEAERKRQEAAKLPPRYNGRCARLTPEERRSFEAEGRRPAIRFRIPPGRVAFDDLIRGRVEIDTENLGGDLVIVRADGTPLYHFTVVVDDAAMRISHVIRGEDHLSNTPKHILLFEALGAAVPRFAHLPLILNPDGTKMSKRKSQTAIRDYAAQGFLPEAIVNYLALLGWATGTEEEILSLDELVERFDLDRVQKGGARFDRERLEWLNGQWIRRLDPADLVDRLRPFLRRAFDEGRIDRLPTDEELLALMPVVQERLPTLAAVTDLIGFLYVEEVRHDLAALVPKRWDPATTAEALRAARQAIADLGPIAFEADELEPLVRRLADERGWKAADLFMAIRVAVTGKAVAPPLFDSLVALGYERTLERLDRAIERLVEHAPATL
ncbi:MAG TPA: glutamate--tRNA ligase [Candidatus Limnocylindrales bacterium]|nr:glutamate--tRNA ligase [Candidatus Limnocylindrales bacterium]